MNPQVPSHNYSPKNPTSQYRPGRDIRLVLLVYACQVIYWDTPLTSCITDIAMKGLLFPCQFSTELLPCKY